MKLLSTFNAKFQDWWLQRSQQERTLLTLGAIVVVGAIIYMGIVTPLQNKVASLQTEWQANRELLNWMQPRVANLKNQALPTAKPIPPTAMLATIDTAIRKEFGASVTETSQTDKNGVQIRLKAVSFDRLLVWLAKEKEQHNIEVSQLSAQKGQAEGIADVVLVLRTKPI